MPRRRLRRTWPVSGNWRRNGISKVSAMSQLVVWAFLSTTPRVSGRNKTMEVNHHEDITPLRRIVTGLGSVFLGSWFAGVFDHIATGVFPPLIYLWYGCLLGLFVVWILAIPVSWVILM